MEEAELARAFTYWQQQGLVNIVSGDPLCVEYLDIASDSPRATRHYAALIAGLQQVLGTRMLSGPEQAKVYDWIEIFGFQEATAVMLVRHCIGLKGPNVKMNYMDAVAKNWANLGLLTPEAAEEYLADYDEYASRAQKVLKRWRRYRPATQDEVELYKKWLGWGFGDEDILAACAGLTGMGTPSFKTLDNRLESMRLNGASGSAGIAEYNKKRAAAAESARLIFERAGLKKAATDNDIDQVYIWLYDWHMNVELPLLAAEYAAAESSKFPQLAKLVVEWHSGGVKTVAEAKKAYEQRGAGRAAGQKKQSARGYMRRTYSAEDYEKIGIKLLDEDDE